jgi:hypothetical protein
MAFNDLPPPEGQHPDYLEALSRDVPQIYPPDAFRDWIAGEPIRDNLSPIREGYRLSPEAVRSMASTLCAGAVMPNRGKFRPNSTQAAFAAAAYAYYNDFVSQKEYWQMLNGRAIRGNHCEEPEDILIKNHPLFHSSIYPSLAEAASDRRWQNPGKTKVFFHGSWNGFPHPVHILYIRDTLTQIEQEYGIPIENMTVLVAGDQNAEIKYTGGKQPAMDTLCRLSLLSYLFEVDLVAPSGSWYPYGDVNRHWSSVLYGIRPDFMSFEANDPLFNEKAKRARAAGVTVLQNSRFGTDGVYDPEQKVNRPLLPGNPMTSRNLWQGNVGVTDQFLGPLSRILDIRRIRVTAYGKRQWFRNNAGEEP